MRQIPDGVISMMVTPMLEGGTVNYGAFYQEIAWCANHGAQGVVVTPSIGEFATLSEDERRACLITCKEYLRKNFPQLFTIATIATTSTESSKFYAKYAHDLGYDAGQINPPYYWVPSEEGVYRHYSEVAEMGLPLVVYNNPRLSKFDIKPRLMARLAKIPGVIAVKEVKTDGHNDLEPLLQAVRTANPSVKVYTTYRAFLYGILLGCNGAFANVQTTPFCRKMWDLAVEDPDWTKGNMRHMKEIHLLMNETFPRGGEDNPYHVATTKMYASLVSGIPMGNARKPDGFPPDFPFHVYEERLREILPELYKLIL